MTNFIQKTHLDISFSAFNCLLDSQCSLLTSQILGRCIKLKWSNRASAVYWLCGTLLCPWSLLLLKRKKVSFFRWFSGALLFLLSMLLFLFFRWLTGALYLSLAILLALAIFEEPEVNHNIKLQICAKRKQPIKA